MKKIFIVLGIVILSAVGIAAGTVQANGKFSVENGNGRAEVAAGQTIDSSWYAAGSQVSLKGTVNGDVYCAGQYVKISGQVNGDVLCAAQQITIGAGAVIDGDVRLAGQNIMLEDNAAIKGSMSTFAQSVTIDRDATVERDVNGAAQHLVVDGSIGRDLVYGLSWLTLNGSIGRNADVALERADFGGSAKVSGDFNYKNRQELDIPDGVVSGAATWHQVKADTAQKDIGARSRALAALSVIAFVVVIALLLPRFISGTAEANRRHIGRVLLAGLVAFGAIIVMPIIAMLLLVSAVGALLVPVVIIAWLLLLMMMLPLFSYYIGRILVGDSIKNIILVSLFGAVVTLIALNVPYVSILVGLAILLIGGGLAVLWLQDAYRSPDYNPVAPVKTAKKSNKR